MVSGPLAIGQVVERYRVEALLGEGGTAAVYRVRHVHLGTEHALKVMTLIGSQAGPRLLLEGRVQAALRHPNIVAVTDVIELGPTWGLLMEYVPPPSLAVWITQNPPRAEMAEQLFRGVVAGVQHAHSHGLVHRDLKPANVLLARDGERLVPKVADFGLARVLDEETQRHTRSGLAMGTPQYMAPEQFRDAKNVDRRADVFSLGCILHELLTGLPAFAWSDMFGVYEAMLHGRRAALPAWVPERMRAVVDGCLVAERDRRIPDCTTVLAMLDGTWRAPTMVPPAERFVGDPDGFVIPVPVDTATWVPDPDATESVPPVAVVERPPLPPTVVQERPALPPPPAPGDSFFAPTSLDLPAPEPEPRRSYAWAFGLGGLAVLGLIAWVSFRAPAEVAEAPVPTPVAPVDGAPAEVVPPPVTTPEPIATPGPIATPASRPPDPRPSVRPSAPEAARPSTPERPPEARPVEVATPPAPSPEPAATDVTAASGTTCPGKARVTYTGDVRKVWLEGASRVVLPGCAPAGHWTVRADFGAGGDVAGEIDTVAGEEVTLRCTPGFRQCSH